MRRTFDAAPNVDVLNWDQATYMPEGGAGARGRQRAMLNRLNNSPQPIKKPALGGLAKIKNTGRRGGRDFAALRSDGGKAGWE
jgi:Zn-dependent M32 family carboxypeptidase